MDRDSGGAPVRVLPAVGSMLEMDEEMKFHVEMESARLIRAEPRPRSRRGAAYVAFGVGSGRCRTRPRAAVARSHLLDCKLGVRMLIKHPSLALIGASPDSGDRHWRDGLN